MAKDRTGTVMSGNGPGLRDRWRGALAAGLFGCVVAGPQQLFDSGIAGIFRSPCWSAPPREEPWALCSPTP